MPVPRSRLIILVAVSLGVLIAAAVGLFVSLSAFAKPVYLRGPGPQVGRVYRDEVTLVLTDGTVRLSAGGVTDTGRVSIRSEGVFEEEILAVTDGEILKSRTKVIRDHSTEAVTFDGETNTHEEVSKLVGEMIEVGKVGEA